MGHGREGHTATLLPDGRVLVVGGDQGWLAEEDLVLASAEVFEPSTGRFGPTGSMSIPRTAHTASLLLSGQVLITGGVGGSGSVALAQASTELYDSATGRFRPAGSMTRARAQAAATVLADGQVLVTGGGDGLSGVPTSSVEIYDPKTTRFHAAGSLSMARTAHSATFLLDGRVLVCGGDDQPTQTPAGAYVTTAELYDPVSGLSGPLIPMNGYRIQHTATRLTDGRVLVAGGWYIDSPTPAELFMP
jgi:hypothetical protein